MKAQFRGTVISTKMQHTAIVEVVRRIPHKMYKKLITRGKKFKADTREISVELGDKVVIRQTKPMSKDKHFKITQNVTKK